MSSLLTPVPELRYTSPRMEKATLKKTSNKSNRLRQLWKYPIGPNASSLKNSCVCVCVWEGGGGEVKYTVECETGASRIGMKIWESADIASTYLQDVVQ